MKKELVILSPTAILGYGFPLSSFEEGMRRKPDVIAVDAGSTDPGPYYLGAGKSFTDPTAVKRDLQIMLTAAVKAGIPLLIGSAGGSGGQPHLDECVDIVKQIAVQQKLSFSCAVINAEIDKQVILDRMDDIEPMSAVPQLTADDVKNSTRIVAQMGTQPFVEALQRAQVIIAGRAYDPAVFSAYPIYKGYDVGLAVHLGKILECASIAATPGSGSDCILGRLGDDYFIVEPLNPIRKCTVMSVAAHTLYEKSNPSSLPGPGGCLDLCNTVFTQHTPDSVKVVGSKHIDTPYAVKLEGVKRIGSRTVSIGGTRDPIMIEKIDSIIDGVRERVKDNFGDSDYFLDFKLYGKNGVMGDREPSKAVPHELGIVVECVAQTQEKAATICSFARSTMLHYGYEGRISTAGNLAFPYSPSDLNGGDVYQFCVYHLIKCDPLEFFDTKYLSFVDGKCEVQK